MKNQSSGMPNASSGSRGDTRRKIEWNRVTWYSKVAAVIVGIAVYMIGFYTGAQYQAVKTLTVAAQGNLISSATFVCDGGKTIDAKFFAAPSETSSGSVSLTLSDGRVMTLPQTISADGGRYANADQSFVFWEKGNGAFIEEGTATDPKTGASPIMTYANCVSQSQK